MRQIAISLLLSFFRLLLHLYPRPFQEEFGQEMVVVLTEQVRAAASGGSLRMIILCGREFSALTAGAFVQWAHTLQAEPSLLAQTVGGLVLARTGRRLRARAVPALFLALLISCGLLAISTGRNFWYVTYDESLDVRHVALGDLNGDRTLDAFLSVGSIGDGFWRADRVVFNDGRAGFTDSGQELGEWRSFAASTGDIDGDAYVDAIVASYIGLQQYRNDGSGHFEGTHYDIPVLAKGSWMINVSLADLDGDGTLDAFVTACCGYIVTPNPRNDTKGSALSPRALHPYSEVWLNDGDGRLVNTGQRIGRAGSHSVALGDLNGDGTIDAFLANGQTLIDGDDEQASLVPDLFRTFSCAISNNDSSGIRYSYKTPNTVWFNNGQGDFVDSGQELGRAESMAAALGDVNGDGFLDAVVGNCGADEIWLNDSRGNFSLSDQRLGRGLTWSVHLADMDGDGHMDLFLAGETNGRVWLNDGDGRYRRGQRIGYDRYDSIALGDLDGDGLADVLAAGVDSYRVWLGQGDGRFRARNRADYR